MAEQSSINTYLKKHIAIPGDHGSWVFLLSPLIIGFAASGRWQSDNLWLLMAALGIFLIRQPASILVKVYAGRRPRRELPAARLWFSLYLMLTAISLSILVLGGHAEIIWLGIPGILVFAWHLYLVSKRAERHQMGVDILASGVLALAAPAAYWVSLGFYAPTGWLLWLLTWLQSAASIVYAFLRLRQRKLRSTPDNAEKWRIGFRALIYSSFNLGFSLLGSIFNLLPPFLWMAYALQWLETIWGITHPAIGVKPTRIGIRQLVISTLFTILFILTW